MSFPATAGQETYHMSTSSLDTIKAREESLLCRTYGRYPVSIASGNGSRVTDLDDKE